MTFIQSGHTFLNRGLQYPARSDVSHLPIEKPIAAGGNTLAKKRIKDQKTSKAVQLFFAVPLISPNDRTTKEWTTIAWPTNMQSRTPDGKFGPARQIEGWNDCWFLAALAAVANDPEGQKILTGSIKKVSVEGIDGYRVTFAGSPNNTVFISDQELANCVDTNGGDADTRLMGLAADKMFQERGYFKSLYIATLLKRGFNQDEAEECVQQFCSRNNLQNSMTYNPMRDGGYDTLACFMLTGMYPVRLTAVRSPSLQRSDIMAYLNQYVTNDRDGASIVISGQANPLGNTPYAQLVSVGWDVIRTEITSNGTVDPRQRAFLNALEKWLETPDDNNREALQSAAENLWLQHVQPVTFVDLLDRDQIFLRQNHRNVLRSGVQEVLAGGSGYIGFPGTHCGTIEGIDKAANTFTYSETNYPTVVYTGELSSLIQAIRSGKINLSAFDPTIERDEAESSHAGEKRSRHLRQLHNHVVRDGKIDPAESGPLANLMEMDAGAFQYVYDSDKNGVIEGSELTAVQLRVDRWVDHFKLTPIW